MSADLSYFVPHHGCAKVSLCIPESFNLYACPPSCVRRVSLRALRNGSREAMGFLYLSEADVAAGSSEDAIMDAVAQALASLEQEPRAFLIHLNCIDDFLGTDEDALLEGLRARFPLHLFTVVRMDPIASDRGLPPGLRVHDRLYSMLEPSPTRDKAVNLVGNFVGLDEECELFDVLRAWGVDDIRQLFACADFDAYRRLAASRLNVVVSFIGSLAAESMEARLGIPFLHAPVSYDVDEVRLAYGSLQQALDPSSEKAAEALALAEESARRAVSAARAAVGSTPIIVDSSAAMRPFAMAKALMGYGFTVQAIVALHLNDHDADERAWLERHHPEVQLVRGATGESLSERGLSSDAVCIGFDSAYLLKAARFVDMQKDEGLFGFYAVRHLMDGMAKAMAARAERG